MRRSSVTALRTARGAIKLEFAILSLLLMGIVGFLFEAGVAYFHYHLLVHSTSKMSRSVAVNTQGRSCPSDLVTYAKVRTRTHLQNSFGVDASSVTFDGSLVEQMPNGRCVLRLKGAWPIHCFFCIFLQEGMSIHTEAETLIEDECFDAADGAVDCSC